MDDKASSDDIHVGTGAHFPKIRRQLKTASTIRAEADIAEVAEMELAFAPLSVRDVGGIPMPASRCPVCGAAVTVLVDVNGVKPRGSAVDFDEERNLVADLCKRRGSCYAISARRTNYRNRLLRSRSVDSSD